VAITTRIQNAGTEVVEAKAGAVSIGSEVETQLLLDSIVIYEERIFLSRQENQINISFILSFNSLSEYQSVIG